ncbi:hypothetical protein [Capnocytophaga sp. oral taxon 336]|uniref:hypothetical protein n=1 Tax=Capnocytophaga sp. oral taxon 336 TaxID=712216 RepID=UPI00034E5A5B|nr:hypothetical protein [Capnocytophaga sp. oral taxon 336]EPE01661.1 hypothetical protein HMPREF1528_00495 [Capnocytophaga sp. oral taxon 336 str. F0502]
MKFNFYLANIGYEKASITELEESFITLNKIAVTEAKPEDTFLKSKTFFEINTSEGSLSEILFSQDSKFKNKELSKWVLPKMLGKINEIEASFETLNEIDIHCPDEYNAFWGACFEEENERHIDAEEKYHSFKEQKVQEITKGIEIWERRSLLFKRIELCPGVKTQLKSIGYTEQILEKLRILDKYCQDYWIGGSFIYNDANQRVALKISPESDPTMNDAKKKQMRMFKLPNGKTECFELHIKTGDLRFHFFPDNNSLKIYIGYIGTHLPT